MGKDSITRQTAVLKAALALADAQEKAAEISEWLAAGELYAARWNAREVVEYITQAITFAWAFADTPEEAALLMREAQARAAEFLERRLERKAAEESVEDGEVPF